MYPKLGHIDFLNVLPLKYALEHGMGAGLSVVRGVPAELNAEMAAGNLDVSNVSSILYAREYEHLTILPEVCVSSDGAVQSILLISRVPLENLTGESVALTAKSATSHCLLKIILAAAGAMPSFSVADIAPENPLADARTAALLIGDDALWCYHHRKLGYYYYDLGAEWKKLTGKKMVYALWVARREFARLEHEELKLVQARLKKVFTSFEGSKIAIVRSALADKPFTYNQLADYIGNVIRYNLTDDYLAGLKEFYRRAAAINLIARVPELNIARV